MVNPLYLPELREMIAKNNVENLSEFCEALHPARTADFMEGLTADAAWFVLSHTDPLTRASIFTYFDENFQVDLVQTIDRNEIAALVSELAPDDRVDLLNEVPKVIVEELLPLLPTEERHDILHLRSYPEGTAGAVMTTDVAKLSDELTIRDAISQLQDESEELETIYYLYVVDEHDHLRGLVSARQLLASMRKPDTLLRDIMETGLVTVEVDDDQEEVAQKVARYDLLAIPVVDLERKMLGIITYDDVIDVVREEATEDAHRSAAMEPLEDSYLDTGILTLVWKRGIWLMVLFVAALLTACVLGYYDEDLRKWSWLMWFVPLVISSGGNAGNQSATLVITALNAEDIKIADWGRVLRREAIMGLLLGIFLAACGLVAGYALTPEARSLTSIWVLPLTIVTIVICGSLVGSMLPLFFQKIGLDPALMSNPFVAGIVDIVGIVIYMNVAWLLL
jgi:magnesium transporter